MKPMTIEATIQIGYDCGLTTLDEAYRNVMYHYDCFFLIEHLHEQKEAYDKLFIDRGYTEIIGEGLDSYCRLRPLLIVDVAKDLGYELQDTFGLMQTLATLEEPENLDNSYEIEGFE